MATTITIQVGDIELQRKAKFSVSIDGQETLCISAQHAAEVVRRHYGGAAVISACDVYNACSTCPRRGKARLAARWPSNLNIRKLRDDTSFGGCAAADVEGVEDDSSTE